MAKPAPWDKMTAEQRQEWCEQLVPYLDVVAEIGLDRERDRFWANQKGMPSATVGGRHMVDRDEVQEWIEKSGGIEGVKTMILEAKRRYFQARGEELPASCWHESEPAPAKT